MHTINIDDGTKDGNKILESVLDKLSLDLTSVVAQCAVWAHPRVVQLLMSEDQNPHATWTSNCKRAQGAPQRPKTFEGDIYLDDNTQAGTIIRHICGMMPVSKYKNWAACHLWENTCYDCRYHTSIPNLVLLPKPLYTLTDFHSRTVDALRYKSYDLYGWHPEGLSPQKPKDYDYLKWREPCEFNSRIETAISRRSKKKINKKMLHQIDVRN